MIGERDAGGIEHLQEQIPYQAMRLFDLVEKQDASLVVGENLSQPSGAARLVAHE